MIKTTVTSFIRSIKLPHKFKKLIRIFFGQYSITIDSHEALDRCVNTNNKQEISNCQYCNNRNSASFQIFNIVYLSV